MPFNTRNPIPSGDLRDLDDNARNIDTWANDKTKLSHPDRFGVQRRTWHGIEQEAQLNIQQAIDAKNAAQEAAMLSGFSKYADTLAQLEAGIGTDYLEGDVVMVFQDESRGDTSSIFKIESGVAVFKNAFDKTRQDLLSFTGTISAGAEWSDVPAHSDPAFDVQARALANRTEFIAQELTQPSGDDPIGGFSGLEALRAYSGAATSTTVLGYSYKKLPSAAGLTDDGVVVIDSDGSAWRLDSDRVDVRLFGAGKADYCDDALFWSARAALKHQLAWFLPRQRLLIERYAVALKVPDGQTFTIISDDCEIYRDNNGDTSEVLYPDGTSAGSDSQYIIDVRTVSAQSLAADTGTSTVLIGTLTITPNSPEQWDNTNYASTQKVLAFNCETDQKIFDTLKINECYGYGLRFAYNRFVKVGLLKTDRVGGRWYLSDGYDAFGDSLYLGYNKPGARIKVDADIVGYAGKLSRAGIVFEYSTGSNYTCEINLINANHYERAIHLEESSGLDLQLYLGRADNTPLFMYCMGTPTALGRVHVHGGDVRLTIGDYGGAAGWVSHYESTWPVRFFETKINITRSVAPNLLNTSHYKCQFYANLHSVIFSLQSGENVDCEIYGLGVQSHMFYEGRGVWRGGIVEADMYIAGTRKFTKNGDRDLEEVSDVIFRYHWFDIKALVKRDVTREVYDYSGLSSLIGKEGESIRIIGAEAKSRLLPFGISDELASYVRIPFTSDVITLSAENLKSEIFKYASRVFLVLKATDGSAFDSLYDYATEASGYYVVDLRRAGSPVAGGWYIAPDAERNFSAASILAIDELEIKDNALTVRRKSAAATTLDVLVIPARARGDIPCQLASGPMIGVY